MGGQCTPFRSNYEEGLALRMSTTLLAPELIPLEEIRTQLRQNGVDIALIRLDASFDLQVPNKADSFFLLLEDQDLISSGELTNRVRRTLRNGERLILCMPFPTNRKALIEMGADEIISPAAKAVGPVAERILAQIILDRNIQPSNCGLLYGATKPMQELFQQIENLGTA